MEQRLSSPPYAMSWFCVFSNAHVITHELLKGIACTLLVVIPFHTISFPSWLAETRFIESPDQSIAYIFPKCPFKTRRSLSGFPIPFRSFPFCNAAWVISQSDLSAKDFSISLFRVSAFFLRHLDVSVYPPWSL